MMRMTTILVVAVACILMQADRCFCAGPHGHDAASCDDRDSGSSCSGCCGESEDHAPDEPVNCDCLCCNYDVEREAVPSASSVMPELHRAASGVCETRVVASAATERTACPRGPALPASPPVYLAFEVRLT